ncbi:MarR family winged helix-turn-helix transcriptional regulator [Actinoplanes sp. TFC3]|uniref:MarR family winged helix-turn-helix transcriptional regulator n=1 Tax=Actinoplanes sp. TFC3 TaxID=1710355 RepID=UPI0009E82EDD|nr:MarR family winged helix-turn-helix transcriptional regulator [Actinoplanes sp. TFC3]
MRTIPGYRSTGKRTSETPTHACDAPAQHPPHLVKLLDYILGFVDRNLLDLPVLVLGAARALVDGIDAGVRARGFTDIRPAHGFAFARLSGSGATVVQLAEHLDVTKQAASQMVDELVRRGYVERHPHPTDARARLIVLTARGQACTRAADEAAVEVLQPWAAALGEERLAALRTDLARLAAPGRLRPIW